MSDLDDDIVCPSCHHHHTPDEIYPANEEGYVVGEHWCQNCYLYFDVQTFTMYRGSFIYPLRYKEIKAVDSGR